MDIGLGDFAPVNDIEPYDFPFETGGNKETPPVKTISNPCLALNQINPEQKSRA
jgi:hypothetical protein